MHTRRHVATWSSRVHALSTLSSQEESACACSPLLLLLLLLLLLHCGDRMSFLHTCSHSGIRVWADVAVLLYGVLDVLSQCVFGIILLRKPPPALSDWDQEEKYQVLSLPALGDSRRMLTYAVPIADVC